MARRAGITTGSDASGGARFTELMLQRWRLFHRKGYWKMIDFCFAREITVPSVALSQTLCFLPSIAGRQKGAVQLLRPGSNSFLQSIIWRFASPVETCIE